MLLLRKEQFPGNNFFLDAVKNLMQLYFRSYLNFTRILAKNQARVNNTCWMMWDRQKRGMEKEILKQNF